MRSFFMRYSLYFAWLIAAVSTLGSLYFSEIQHLDPCKVCWYQRICLFPLTIQLGIAAWKGFLSIIPYVFPQCILGLLLAGYHVFIQYFPGSWATALCNDGSHNCALEIHTVAGHFSLPMLSALAFFSIICFLSIAEAFYLNHKA